jgi:uncharacterized protein (DUF2062 family)
MSEPRRRPKVGSRWRIAQAALDMHYQLRTEGDTPVRQALSMWLGVIIGCTPLWGAHLLFCATLGKFFGLSRVKCYVAANINNPLTAPFLLYVEVLVGHWITHGTRLTLTLDQIREVGVLKLGLDILLGSLVVGVIAGGLLAAFAFVISSRWPDAPLQVRLKEETSKRYRYAGIFNWEFVRGRLRHDPIYYQLIVSGILPREGRLADLGAGRGILLTLIVSAETIGNRGEWPGDAPPPPAGLTLTGVESDEEHAGIARMAVGDAAEIVVADLADYEPPPCRTIVLLDVLHHLAPDRQVALLLRCARALEPGGKLLLREQDASAGARFVFKRIGLRLWAILRGARKQRMHFRDLGEWMELLREAGLEPKIHPISAGTRQASMLVEATAGGPPELAQRAKEDVSVRAGAALHETSP